MLVNPHPPYITDIFYEKLLITPRTMSKSVELSARLHKHFENIYKLKKDIKSYEDRKFLLKMMAKLKI